MGSYKKLILGVIGVLSIVTTLSSTPAYAGGFSSGHKDYNTTGQNTGDVSSAETYGHSVVGTASASQAQLREGWNIIDGADKICYVKDGVKQYGWQNIGGWKFFDKSSGFLMKNAWLQDGGNWYYLDCQGKMYSSIFVNGLGSFNASGAWLGYSNTGLTVSKDLVVVHNDLSAGATQFMSVSDFNAKVSNGTIKAGLVYGSTGGSGKIATLIWYLA